MSFEPGQLTRESERIRVTRIENAREELASERAAADAIEHEALEPARRCEQCGAKLTVQIFPHGYEARCTPCERRARFENAPAAA